MIETLQYTQATRRRQLLPLWIKIFIWLFMLIGCFIPLLIILASFGQTLELAIYGIETNEAFSLDGILIILLLSFKAMVAFSLWYEKPYAILIAIIDAFLGIVICLFLMLATLVTEGTGSGFPFRLELIFLIAYLVNLKKIRAEWN